MSRARPRQKDHTVVSTKTIGKSAPTIAFAVMLCCLMRLLNLMLVAVGLVLVKQQIQQPSQKNVIPHTAWCGLKLYAANVVRTLVTCLLMDPHQQDSDTV